MATRLDDIAAVHRNGVKKAVRTRPDRSTVLFVSLSNWSCRLFVTGVPEATGCRASGRRR